jgi:recombination protein RecR
MMLRCVSEDQKRKSDASFFWFSLNLQYLCMQIEKMNEQFSSQLLERAVEAFSGLPGVGRKTALRLALFLLKQDDTVVKTFAQSILEFKNEVKFCKICHNLSDTDECEICRNPGRNRRQICVVENVQDVLAIENTQQYQGLYHVLGGVISPMDGVGPSDLEINSLVERVKTEGADEVILALSATMEGDTTNFYISRRLEGLNVTLSTIARGVSIGDTLEYADEITLGRSIVNRVAFKEENH